MHLEDTRPVFPPHTWARATRRALLGTLAAATSAGAFLTACARGGAAPQSAQPITELTFAPWNWSAQAAVQAVMQQALTSFEAKHPGVRVKVVPGNGCCDPTGDTATLLAGSAPDVFTDNDYWAFDGTNLLMPLDTYLQQDNVSLSLWPAQEIKSLQTAGGIFALPCYYNMQMMVVNFSIYNEAGLSYPPRNWDNVEFVRQAAAVTSDAGGHHRYGCTLDWGMIGPNPTIDWVLRGFGGSLTNATGTQCLLNSQAAIDAGNWVYSDLFWPGVGTASANFLTGQTVMAQVAPSGLVGFVTGVNKTLQWDFYPNPTFPSGPAVMAPAQWYMANPGTRQPELAWKLLKWVCAETDWQKAMMRLFLVPPALNSLWTEWEQVVQAVAPPLQGKSLSVFADAAQSGYAYPYPGFRYADVSAKSVIGAMLGKIQKQQTTVAEAFPQTATLINNMEEAAAAGSRAANAAKAQFPSTGGRSIASVTPGL